MNHDFESRVWAEHRHKLGHDIATLIVSARELLGQARTTASRTWRNGRKNSPL